MGRAKQLLLLGEKPVIRRCIDTLLEGGIDRLAVVVSDCGSGFSGHLAGLPLTVAVNDNPASDMAESVRIGLRHLKPGSAVLVSLCDHPLVTVETIKALLHEHRLHPRDIIIPAYKGRRGHPTLFPESVIGEIFTGITLRDIVRKDPDRVRIVSVHDKGAILDMDTPADYEAIRKLDAAK